MYTHTHTHCSKLKYWLSTWIDYRKFFWFILCTLLFFKCSIFYNLFFQPPSRRRSVSTHVAGAWERTWRVSFRCPATFLLSFSFYLGENVFIDVVKETKHTRFQITLVVDCAALLFSMLSLVLHSEFLLPWAVESLLRLRSQPFEACTRITQTGSAFPVSISLTNHGAGSCSGLSCVLWNRPREFLSLRQHFRGRWCPWRPDGATGG